MQTKYRKKPVVIEAMQFTYPPTDEFMAWFGQPTRMTKARHPEAKEKLEVLTLEDGADARAKHVATEGDWIIRGVQGELYPCKPDIFAATYEPA
jgi:hypothetical protein